MCRFGLASDECSMTGCTRSRHFAGIGRSGRPCKWSSIGIVGSPVGTGPTHGGLEMRYCRTLMIGTVSALALTAGSAMAQDSETTEVDEVIVTGIRASIEESIDTKREADAIVDVITAEDVGKFPDKNVAEALQRIPGVVINREFGEGERVSLRGTSPNLTRTLIDGHGLATADWFILEQLSATR
eukprot:gene5392-7136_t